MKKDFVARDPELEWEERQKLFINEVWIDCLENFTLWLSNTDIMDQSLDRAIRTGQLLEKDKDHFLETNFRELTRDNFTYYSKFCSYSFIVWEFVKFKLKHLSPKEREGFSQKIRELRRISENHEEVTKIFEQLNEHFNSYLPFKRDIMEMRI